MKVYLSYNEMLEILKPKIEILKERKYDEVVAVVRGGLTVAHYIAKKLRLTIGFYYPSNETFQTPRIITSGRKPPKKILFVEDLVAKGRTYNELVRFMEGFPEVEYDFFPLLLDGDYPDTMELYGMKTNDWIVMPYEEMDEMVEGDRGLFRNNTDQYGKSQ